MPNEIETSIRLAYAALAAANGFVAVRSSAVDEDSADTSFAGMHDSFLFVRGEDRVIESVKAVWASAYSDRAIAYRLQNDLPLGDISVAVVVQAMVDATRSGVVFTCDPATESARHIVVSSLYGAGEGLVSQGLEADTFIVDKTTRAVTSRLGVKREQMVVDADRGGLRRIAVS